MELRTLCRACLDEMVANVDALNGSRNQGAFLSPKVGKKFTRCTSLNVDPLDGLPKYLCIQCWSKVEEFYKFRVMCALSARLLSESIELHSQELQLFHEDKKRDLKELAETILHLGKCKDALSNIPVICDSEKHPQVKPKPMNAKKTKSHTDNAANKRESKRQAIEAIIVETASTASLQAEVIIEAHQSQSEAFNNWASTQLSGDEDDYEMNKDSSNSSTSDYMWTEGQKRQKSKNQNTMKSSRHDARAILHFSADRRRSSGACSKSPSTASINKQFQCDICPARFFVEHRLAAHKRSHQGLVPYPCDRTGCNKTFNRWHCLSVHLKQHDGTSQSYTCDEDGCNKVYKHKPTLNMHLRKAHKRGPPLKTHVCEICGKVFKASSILNDHRYTHKDNSELPFACDQPECARRFSTREKLKVHVQRHQGIKNFACPFCGLRKTTRNELKIHINYHTLERTFPCTFCTHICNSAGNLKMHVHTVHERARDFACRYCERKFAKSDTRKYHEMTHTGEKPNECQECGKRFTQPAALRTHKKIHQRTQPDLTQTPTATTIAQGQQKSIIVD